MEEAERLCHRVEIFDRGRIVALGTVPNLVASLDVEHSMSLTVDGVLPLARLEAVPGVVRVEHTAGRTVVRGNGVRFPQEMLGVPAEADLWAKDLRTEQPTLEDVFRTLTGRELREEVPA